MSSILFQVNIRAIAVETQFAGETMEGSRQGILWYPFYIHKDGIFWYPSIRRDVILWYPFICRDDIHQYLFTCRDGIHRYSFICRDDILWYQSTIDCREEIHQLLTDKGFTHLGSISRVGSPQLIWIVHIFFYKLQDDVYVKLEADGVSPRISLQEVAAASGRPRGCVYFRWGIETQTQTRDTRDTQIDPGGAPTSGQGMRHRNTKETCRQQQ